MLWEHVFYSSSVVIFLSQLHPHRMSFAATWDVNDLCSKLHINSNMFLLLQDSVPLDHANTQVLTSPHPYPLLQHPFFVYICPTADFTMPSYSTNVGPYAELNAAEAQACGHLDYLFEQRRGWHQQQPEHAAERAQLPEDGDYGRFFSILQEIADGVPGYTVDDLTFSLGGDAMENTISCEIDRWRHNPPVMREYARVFCRVQIYHESKRDSTCPGISTEDIACEIMQSSELGQLTGKKIFVSAWL